MEKKIREKCFLLLFFFGIAQSHAQDSFTKELEWVISDSTASVTFPDTDQIIEWEKKLDPKVIVQSELFSVGNCSVFIVKIDKCSGIYCPTIHVFKRADIVWSLVASTHANLNRRLTIRVKENDLVFETTSGQIGRLPIEKLGTCKAK